MKSTLNGTGVALATPMKSDYSVDYDGLLRLMNHAIDGGIDYLVVMGTTAESPVFSWKEKLKILDFIIDKNAERKPILFGLGGNDTYGLIKRTKDIKDHPIEGILSVSPYYSKPSQKGIIRHYSLLADAFPKPVMLYNIPSRTNSNLTTDTILELAYHPNITAIKEASGNLEQINRIIHKKPEDFKVISGDDHLTYHLLKNGCVGVISVVANILPALFTRMVNATLNQNHDAEMLDQRLQTAYQLLAQEGNPVSLKKGLSVLNICSETVKPPLFEGSDELGTHWKKYLSNFRT